LEASDLTGAEQAQAAALAAEKYTRDEWNRKR
jgi:lipoate-protein ligase A